MCLYVVSITLSIIVSIALSIILSIRSDIPDFFWKERTYEPDYHFVISYLEMSGRTSSE